MATKKRQQTYAKRKREQQVEEKRRLKREKKQAAAAEKALGLDGGADPGLAENGGAEHEPVGEDTTDEPE